MNRMYTTWQSSLCEIIIVADKIGLTNLYLKTKDSSREFTIQPGWEFQPEAPLLQETITQLKEYFSKNRTTFSLPLHPAGTTFQKLTWQALTTIPYGETRSYKKIAEQVGRPKAARAVGMANNKNPLPLLFPCHRVIASSGKLTGFAAGIQIKQKLLNMEAEFPATPFQEK